MFWELLRNLRLVYPLLLHPSFILPHGLHLPLNPHLRAEHHSPLIRTLRHKEQLRTCKSFCRYLMIGYVLKLPQNILVKCLRIALVYKYCICLQASLKCERDLSYLTLSDQEQRELYEAAQIIQKAYRSYKGRSSKGKGVGKGTSNMSGSNTSQDSEARAAVLIQNYYRRYKQVRGGSLTN